MSDVLSWARIRTLALRHKRLLIGANSLAVVAVALSVPIPLLLPLLVDEVLLEQGQRAVGVMNLVLPQNWQSATGYILLVLLLSILLRVASLLLGVLSAKGFAELSKDIIWQVRTQLLAKLERISLREYETLGSGKVAAYLLTDLDTLDAFLSDTLSRALVALLSLLGTSVILLLMHWQLALLILLLNPWVVLVTVKLGKRIKWLKKRENETSAHFTQALTETLDAIHELRASGRQQHYFSRLIALAGSVRDSSSSAKWKTEAAGRGSGVLFQFGIDIFRAAAMLTVLFSDLSIGQMLAVFSYLWFMVGPVEQMLNLQYSFYGASAALERVNELNLRETEPQYPRIVDPFAAAQPIGFSLEQICFNYQQEPVFQGLTFSVIPGERVAIVGASGAGKSTLVQLLLGLYKPASGSIRYGGAKLENIGYARVREQVAVVQQHPAIFDDSIRANLTLGQHVSDQACWQALEQAQLAETVRQLPEGLDTRLGRFGVRLSGGQRQRIAIARMLLAEPKIVIMDEATSALDTLTETQLHQALEAFFKDRTVLLIAHRLSAVRQAQKILVLSEGRVVEEGSHEQLLINKGHYFQLYGHLLEL